MVEMKNIQINNSTLFQIVKRHWNQASTKENNTLCKKIKPGSLSPSIDNSLLSENSHSKYNRFYAGINRIENTPVFLNTQVPFQSDMRTLSSRILSNIASVPAKQEVMLIPIPFKITEDLECYAPVRADYFQDMSSKNSTLLYSILNKGYLVVKDFGKSLITGKEDRVVNKQIDATMEVFISKLGKKLQVNVPKSWILPNTDIKNTTVISEYIEHRPTNYPHHYRGFDALQNNHCFINTYRDSKLPVFHYLINHPHVQIDSTTYANILVSIDCELFSIDHEGCLNNGRRRPSFNAEQINNFFPDRESYEKFKNMNLTDEVNSAFGSILKEHNKKVSDIRELNTVDLEFRKNHLIGLH